MKGRYYFITYGAKRTGKPTMDYWNSVTDKTPMEFIRDEETAENSMHHPKLPNYLGFIVLSVHEITRLEYNEWRDEF